VNKNQEIIVSSANKKYLYDEKKNRFLDFCMSSGCMILGHSNKIYSEEIKKQISLGSNYSSNNIYKKEYEKKLKKEFKQFDSFVFCNSGSEANLRALRIAKSISKKNKVVMTSGSWHGSVDNFLFDLRFKNKEFNNYEFLSSGVELNKKETIIIPHNEIKGSKRILDKNISKISMIIVEPIQASHPNTQNYKYLKFLENYCKKKNVILCFDEIITGLRVKNLTIYKKYKLKPDMVTFAKCFGGGLPIGIVAYNKIIKKKLKKLKQKIFFGGTFSGNALSTRIGCKTFEFILKNQNRINTKINYLGKFIENKINHFCKKNRINFKFLRYESILKPSFNLKSQTKKYEKNKNFIQFRNYLLKNKIFISNNCCFFISYCHDIHDCSKLIMIIKKFLLSNKEGINN
jgi:glutamate-1-semialdehyde 2,1-aminomutase